MADLTRWQFRVYAMLFAGHTQTQVAGILGVHQSSISQAAKRAIARNPRLPAIRDHRKRRTVTFCGLPPERRRAFAEILGLT